MFRLFQIDARRAPARRGEKPAGRAQRAARSLAPIAVMCLTIGQVSLAADALAATPAKGAKRGDFVTSPDTGDGRVAAPRPWTAEEMENAIPYPVPSRPAGAAAQSAAKQKPLGEPGFSPGQPPLSELTPSAPSAAGEGALDAQSDDSLGFATSLDAEPLSTSYPGSFTRFDWPATYRKFPMSAVGKLFFTQNGVNYVCSASVINKDQIFTAGHCVHAGNNLQSGWSTNMQFCPSYKNGVNSAVGCWNIVRLATSTPWFSSSDFDRDWGGGKVSTCGSVNCTSIGNFTGWLGFAWNFSNEHVFDFGYPQAPPFTGKRLVTCSGEVSYRADMGVGADSKYIGCDMTGGSSGGPWILGFAGGNWLDGVNSHKRCTQAGCPAGSILTLEMGSPPFTNEPGGTNDFMAVLFAL